MLLPQLSHNPRTWLLGTVALRPAPQASACTRRSSMAALGLPVLRWVLPPYSRTPLCLLSPKIKPVPFAVFKIFFLLLL